MVGHHDYAVDLDFIQTFGPSNGADHDLIEVMARLEQKTALYRTIGNLYKGSSWWDETNHTAHSFSSPRG